MTSKLGSALGWLFRDRRTGRIVIAQFPNLPLTVAIIAALLRWLVHGTAGTIFGVIAALAFAFWAGDEIVRGVNPWRRLLGVVVLGAVAISLLTAS